MMAMHLILSEFVLLAGMSSFGRSKLYMGINTMFYV